MASTVPCVGVPERVTHAVLYSPLELKLIMLVTSELLQSLLTSESSNACNNKKRLSDRIPLGRGIKYTESLQPPKDLSSTVNALSKIAPTSPPPPTHLHIFDQKAGRTLLKVERDTCRSLRQAERCNPRAVDESGEGK